MNQGMTGGIIQGETPPPEPMNALSFKNLGGGGEWGEKGKVIFRGLFGGGYPPPPPPSRTNEFL